MNHTTNIDASTRMALEEDKKDDGMIMDVEESLGNDLEEKKLDKKGDSKMECAQKVHSQAN